MKQWITEQQFNELKDPQKDIWYKWIEDHHYTFEKIYPYIDHNLHEVDWHTLNFPSIGEMIEFLGEQLTINNDKAFNDTDNEVELEEIAIYKEADGCWRLDGYFKSEEMDELCDALWEAVKEVLEDNK